MTERSDAMRRLITDLRSLDGTPAEVAELAERLPPKLLAPRPSTQLRARPHASRAPRLFTRGRWPRAWLVSGLALIGAVTWYGAENWAPSRVQRRDSAAGERRGPAGAVAAAAEPIEIEAAMNPSPSEPTGEPAVNPEPTGPRRSPERAGPARRAVRERPARQAAAGPELELSLIARAQGALDRDPARALGLAAEHGRDYPRGLFVEEREVIAIEAELKLRRTAAARERAARFIAAFPRSTHARKMRVLIEP